MLTCGLQTLVTTGVAVMGWVILGRVDLGLMAEAARGEACIGSLGLWLVIILGQSSVWA